MLNNVFLVPDASGYVEFGSTYDGIGTSFRIESDGGGGGTLAVPSPPVGYSSGTDYARVTAMPPNGNFPFGSYYAVDPHFNYEVMVSEVSPLFDSFVDTFGYGFIDAWYPITGPIRIDGYYYPGIGGASFKYSLRRGIDGVVVTEKTLWIESL